MNKQRVNMDDEISHYNGKKEMFQELMFRYTHKPYLAVLKTYKSILY